MMFPSFVVIVFFLLFSPVVQMNVTQTHVATAEAFASTQMEATNASVVRAINTWCSMGDLSALVSSAALFLC